MKKIILAIVAIMTAIDVNAQTNLTGRVYHNPNIMANTGIKKQAEAAKKCMSTAITVEFTSATDLVMRQKNRVDDEALKILGVGWLKRKALKASLALMPESQKAKYEVKGNKVIVIDDKDSDTLTIGNDGNTLSGIFDKETKYTLKRTK